MDRIGSPRIYEDTVTFQGGVNHKAASVLNEAIGANAAAPIDAEKVEKEFTLRHETAIGSAVTAFDLIKHIAQAAGEIVDVEIAVETIATGDNKITIDVQVWNGTSWASVLASTEDVDATYTAKTPKVITLASSSETFVDGNLIRISGTLGGSTGAHAQGLIVQVRVREKP